MLNIAEENFYEHLVGKIAEEITHPPQEAEIVVKEPENSSKISPKGIFSNPDAHPYVLDLILLKHFNLDWLSWLPETLFKEIETTFKSSVAEVNKIKILAIQTLHVTDMFWEQWELFEKVLWALNGHVPIITSIQPPDLPLLYAGVSIADSIRKETYSDEISRYCAAVFLNENVFYAPPPLEFCQAFITQPFYICKDCDKKGSALPPFDGVCTSCGGHFTDETPLNFKPDQEALKRNRGKNLTYGNTYDPDATKQRFEELNKMDNLTASFIKETVEDIQAAKLITAVDFKTYKEKQIAEQLAALRGWLETV